MKIIIMTGKFGMGHISVANSIKQDIDENIVDAEVKMFDIMEFAFPNIYKNIYDVFSWLAKKNPNLYNSFYSSCEGKNKSAFSNVLNKKIEKLIEAEKPDVIISTVVLASRFISSFKDEYNCSIPLITYITDVSSSCEWINNNTNLYVVATKKVKDELVKKGVEEKSIIVNGIPVNKSFAHSGHTSKNSNKSVLIMGGGLGLLPEDYEFYQKLNDISGVKYTVITGRNTNLCDKLKDRYENINVLGFCSDVARYMKQADLIVSKAGGITTFECIQSQTPIVVPCPALAQEVSNAHFIEQKGIGVVMWDKKSDVTKVVGRIVKNDMKLNRMQKRMGNMKKALYSHSMLSIMNMLNIKKAAS